MKISLLNSKKCSTADPRSVVLGAALVLALLSLSPAWAAFGAQAPAKVAPSQASLVQDIAHCNTSTFEPLLNDWSARYGTIAVTPLISIAKDRRNSDRVRYIAVMGAAKLGGPATAEKLVPLLKDKLWMVRSATLKALAILKDPRTGKAVLPLLKDPGLVVRVEAIEAIKAIRPEGASRALLNVLHSQDNYRFGKAQWVPQRALAALVVLQDRSIVPELRPLLDHRSDPELQRQTIFALRTLTGIETDPKLSLDAQVATWKKTLASDRIPIVTSSAHSEPARPEAASQED